MQIKYPHKSILNLFQMPLSRKKDMPPHPFQKSVAQWKKLKTEGVSDALAQDITGISRATFYRRSKTLERIKQGLLPPSKRPKTFKKPSWGEADKQLVLNLRRQNPTYGKAKIAAILKRDFGSSLSESTIGRILKHLMNKGLVQTSLSAPRRTRKRRFKGHAVAFPYGIKPQKLGEMIQVDHMSVSKNQCSFKHFQAWCPMSKYIYANIFANAKSKTAKTFLLEFIKEAPFKILSIQVDGGSEFMADFEEACCALGIKLFVLPPKRPQWNGGVERGNRTFREEFYAKTDILADTLPSLRPHLQFALEKYNTYRPHQNLNNLTPASYIHSISWSDAQSHMY